MLVGVALIIRGVGSGGDRREPFRTLFPSNTPIIPDTLACSISFPTFCALNFGPGTSTRRKIAAIRASPPSHLHTLEAAPLA